MEKHESLGACGRAPHAESGRGLFALQGRSAEEMDFVAPLAGSAASQQFFR